MAKATTTPKVFISYSHDSEQHKQRVLELADRLRNDGIDCELDQYETSPLGGWPQWMTQQIQDADFILVVCTETYAERFAGKGATSIGQGVKWEGAIINQNLYEAAQKNAQFLPVIFTPTDSRFRPLVLRPVTHYNVGTDDGYEDLYRRLTNQPLTPKPELGKIKPLPPRSRVGVGQVTSTPALPERTAAPTAKPQNYESLVLLMNHRREYELIPAARIEADALIKLKITPATTRHSAFLSELRDAYEKSVAIAYGLNAFECRIKGISQLHESGQESWLVTLEPTANDRGGIFYEMAINGLSVDQIATLRARRILLNESIHHHSVSMVNHLSAQMIEHLPDGGEKYLGKLLCPFLELYARLGQDSDYFLAVARLFAVFHLRLAGIIKNILKLDLKLKSETTLDIKFEGTRRQQYANAEPFEIKIKGQCQLAEAEDDDD